MLFGDPNATNPLMMLDGLVYLTPNEATLTEEMVPMIENTRLHTILVDMLLAKIQNSAERTFRMRGGMA